MLILTSSYPPEADGGGSNGHRNRLWKTELQNFVNQTNLEVTVCHFPPGTSKWNKIEHRLFAQISKNWRGRPLESYQIIVNLIASTKTSTGLKVNAAIDPNIYQTGIKVSKKEMDHVNLHRHDFHGENWNYTIKKTNELFINSYLVIGSSFIIFYKSLEFSLCANFLIHVPFYCLPLLQMLIYNQKGCLMQKPLIVL